MTDSQQDHHRERMAFFTSTVAREATALYERSRDTANRLLKGATLGVAGGVGGFLLGVVSTPRGRKDETEVVYLLRQVRIGQWLREFSPMITNTFTNLEYDARKRLEDMGYYPCAECGAPHVSEEPHTFPEGTYWCETRSRYLKPDDADWTQDGFMDAPDDAKWAFTDPEPEDDGEQVH